MFVNLPVFCSLQSLFLQKKKNEFKKKRKKKDEDMANSSPVLHFFFLPATPSILQSLVQSDHAPYSVSKNQLGYTHIGTPFIFKVNNICTPTNEASFFFFSFSLFGGLQSSVSRAKQFPNIIQRGCFRLQNAARCKNGKEGRP